MKNIYKYLVTYGYVDNDTGENNIGTVHLTIDKELKSFKVIEDIIRRLEIKKNGKNLVVTNYILVRKSERKRKFIK